MGKRKAVKKCRWEKKMGKVYNNYYSYNELLCCIIIIQ